MPLTRFEQLLKEAIGLDAASIGASAIERAVSQRQAACGISDPDAYWHHVRGSASELQQLIDAVVVPETWFFRDREPFAALTSVALADWLRGQPTGIFRVLSVPCATGEEPYSVAMALIDAGLPPQRFLIDAFDVSERVLENARRGVYGRRSFRGDDLAFRDRYFEVTPSGARLTSIVRDRVRFHQRNLLIPSPLHETDRYDVIFCRNLLIYFDRPTQDQAIGILERLLAPGGTLFVGSSETGLMLAHGFRPLKMPMSFAFRRGGPKVHQKPAEKPRASAPPRVAPAPPRPPSMPFAQAGSAAPSQPKRTSAAPAATLDEAQRLADEGRFAEAAQSCENYIRQRGPSAPAYYLFGLMHDARHNTQDAEICYRKVLYLDPAHAGALAHLALLLETRGRLADAQLLRNRAARLSIKKTT